MGNRMITYLPIAVATVSEENEETFEILTTVRNGMKGKGEQINGGEVEKDEEEEEKEEEEREDYEDEKENGE